ncbi:hypothetical protein DMUE_2022 [Dictyocoela muelleri]|nr:hypothetical protein DMUE_2022 [Dictyocoela muelleri]
MDNERSQYTISQEISYIANIVELSDEDCRNLVLKIIWIFRYIFDLVIEDKINLKEDKDMKKLTEIILKKFRLFEHTFHCCKDTDTASCLAALEMRSGLHFLMDSFSENNMELREKLENLDTYLDILTEKWPNYVDYYYKAEEMMNDPDDCVDYKHHAVGEMILNKRGIPDSHYWWPEFCRKRNKH